MCKPEARAQLVTWRGCSGSRDLPSITTCSEGVSPCKQSRLCQSVKAPDEEELAGDKAALLCDVIHLWYCNECKITTKPYLSPNWSLSVYFFSWWLAGITWIFLTSLRPKKFQSAPWSVCYREETELSIHKLCKFVSFMKSLLWDVHDVFKPSVSKSSYKGQGWHLVVLFFLTLHIKQCN